MSVLSVAHAVMQHNNATTRVADRGHQEVRDAVVPAAIVDGAAAEADRLPAALQLGALPRVQQGRLGAPREREVSRVLRRQTLQKIFYFLTLYIPRNIDN